MSEKYAQLERKFKNNKMMDIELDSDGLRYFYVKSISKKEYIYKFAKSKNIDIKNLKISETNEKIFDLKNDINLNDLQDFIINEFQKQINDRKMSKETLSAELAKVINFDWGGSFGNSLDKNIVNNYVKKIMNYAKLENSIDNELQWSLKRYTINSWYNHWTSVLIEDIFNSHKAIIPTLSKIKKIDFFIRGIPFDLKVTYFPEELMSQELKKSKYGTEITQKKQKCKELNLPFNTQGVNAKTLNLILENILKEASRTNEEARKFLTDLHERKIAIIDYYKRRPDKLSTWLYENQGEMRFDAGNRFFIVLIDSKNFFESWKLKRNLALLTQNINSRLDEINDIEEFNPNIISFDWKPNGKTYKAKSEVLFIEC